MQEMYLVDIPRRADGNRRYWPYVTQLPCEPAVFKITCAGCFHISQDEGTHGFYAHNRDGNTVIIFVPIGMKKTPVFDNQKILGRL